ncbi:MAG: dihydrolipoyl dehydrogenase [Planctomycetaceae bacterium]|jgi:dihydrolipoamide dehydrogenase|nr:dihydrolipoyl dehydrogenase [Planctomycetaceae bacterium]MBT6157348.1 dihydrolipoyl dehydrogenase [Planctomycetaceae bacterium]MBT6486756.1 dihydrolipoyl dehydrogenase [Planctomycetaceae bacterium]MBT6493729.1 dihydrolipoyl dehydrogenase [Planctomycetaceae bacterium]
MKTHDLIVIGAGPGGYTAAIRAAQLGLDVACIDKEPLLGGTCLRIGCIPSKALLESSELYREAGKSFAQHGIELGEVGLDLAKMLSRKERIVKALTMGVASLLKKNKITSYTGTARLVGDKRLTVTTAEGDEELSAAHILIATGSRPATLPGVELDGDRIGTSTETLSYGEVPPRLVVIGAGYIGLELGTVWQRLGSEVTVLEYLDRILPGTDGEIAGEAQKLFKKQGLNFRLGSQVSGARVAGDHCVVECVGVDPIECDRVLVAVGRKPNSHGLGLETVGVKLNDKDFISVDEQFKTSSPGVYAVGDVIGGAMLAHKAEDEAVACIEQIVNGTGDIDYNAIPSVAYTNPEIAAVGKTEESLQAAGIEFRKGVFPFRANGRARALAQMDGFVKILADAATDRLLGVHILGPRAGDLIAEAVLAIKHGLTATDIAHCSHAHPTLSETFREAALAVHDRAIHI